MIAVAAVQEEDHTSDDFPCQASCSVVVEAHAAAVDVHADAEAAASREVHRSLADIRDVHAPCDEAEAVVATGLRARCRGDTLQDAPVW